MPLNTMTNRLLYVPFSREYTVEDVIQRKLTTEEFFEHCFYYPAFDEQMKEIKLSNTDEIDEGDPATTITISEIEEHIKQHSNSLKEFRDWLINSGTGVYCVVGDAGTGKSTYMNALKYRYKDKVWSLIDIQLANEEIPIMNLSIVFKNFGSLYIKVMATFVLNLVNSLFIMRNGKYDYQESARRLRFLHSIYKEIEDYAVYEDVFRFFKEIPNSLGEGNKEYCRRCSEYIYNWVNELAKHEDAYKLRRCIQLFLIISYFTGKKKKQIIVFDNVERFIGTDEIYNHEIRKFVENMRQILNVYVAQFKKDNIDVFSQHFQFIISMRKTSTRMFTPQQYSDFDGHILDLSEWFPTNEIIKNKISWYEKNGIKIQETELLLSILSDMGFEGEKARGLRHKLNLLFNDNKRIITEFLVGILNDDANRKWLQSFDKFINNKYGIRKDLSRFAMRSIIMRLVLNALREDGFFEHARVMQNGKYIGLGYARKVLTILHNYRLENADEYMPLIRLIELLFNNCNNPINVFLNRSNEQERKKLNEILFYMNYYDKRNKNWMQFIDIQMETVCNEKIQAEDPEHLDTLIMENLGNMKLRITNAGEAYLYYIVENFEYFSCRHGNYAPLLTSIPTEQDLIDKKVNELECIRIIRNVSEKAIKCIQQVRNDPTNNRILLFLAPNEHGLSHITRIVNSHTGYINNFYDCLCGICGNSNNDDVLKKIEEIGEEISKVKHTYSIYLDD